MGLTVGIAGSLLCDKVGPDDCMQDCANSIPRLLRGGHIG